MVNSWDDQTSCTCTWLAVWVTLSGLCAWGEPLLSFGVSPCMLGASSSPEAVKARAAGWEGPCFSLGPRRQVSHCPLSCCHCHYDQGCGARMCFTKQGCCWSYSGSSSHSCPFPCGNTTRFWRIGDCYWDLWCCTQPPTVTGSHLASRCVLLKEIITVWGGSLWAQCVQKQQTEEGCGVEEEDGTVAWDSLVSEY